MLYVHGRDGHVQPLLYDNDYFKVKKLLSKYPENWTYLLYHIGRKALYKILAPKKVTADRKSVV